ncbi:tripartite tricarboxylate transporter substrate binding protein [Variovorax sp. Sphag1AA]|uniref:Bug family tripartite tricarboxylate transporter substrate binding protein n=1 Tax=Variovorax sp. Sphag1AA TaxID=2587027 RepID=UPI0016091DF3|nr:tripartite tricarboxylate transporter substrate binding protein [Variovorax sp. Sphag1AA]MBB3182018.1 tripartite-type tricarboxylate transporter receptor subunit TctC [Variovorax sp. Sphag1AA]
MNRRSLLKLGAYAAYAALPLTQAGAESWPARPVTLVVPWPAGGGTDVIARTVANQLQERLGRPFVVDNRPGASGIIGTELVARAPADGYTFVLGVTNTHAINATFFKQLRYNPKTDFEPVALLATGPHVVLVNSTTPAKNLAEFVEYARQSKTPLGYASYGNGSTAHLISALFRARNNLDMVHVPYKGIPPAITDLMGNQVSMLVSTTGAALPQIKAGKLRAIAVLDTHRIPQLPDVPTMSEQGYPDADYTHWYGIFAPAKVPGAIIARLSSEIEAVLALPQVQKTFADAGVNANYKNPEAFRQFVGAEIERWGKLVELSGVRGD